MSHHRKCCCGRCIGSCSAVAWPGPGDAFTRTWTSGTNPLIQDGISITNSDYLSGQVSGTVSDNGARFGSPGTLSTTLAGGSLIQMDTETGIVQWGSGSSVSPDPECDIPVTILNESVTPGFLVNPPSVGSMRVASLLQFSPPVDGAQFPRDYTNVGGPVITDPYQLLRWAVQMYGHANSWNGFPDPQNPTPDGITIISPTMIDLDMLWLPTVGQIIPIELSHSNNSEVAAGRETGNWSVELNVAGKYLELSASHQRTADPAFTGSFSRDASWSLTLSSFRVELDEEWIRLCKNAMFSGSF